MQPVAKRKKKHFLRRVAEILRVETVILKNLCQYHEKVDIELVKRGGKAYTLAP